MNVLVFGLLFTTFVVGDLYIHNPRGSNNRLTEANEDVTQQNRLFDSQNNAKGGYGVGPAMSFYEGSLLTIEWTVQHGCGNPKLECNMVIQYMCSGKEEADPLVQIRDGTTTNQIPTDATQAQTRDANNELQFGMHESFAYYQECSTRKRNGGLFIADRTLNGPTARFTRQNNNGNRNGFECPEERDYYPYWHPSPWKDVAVLTDKPELCSWYKKESQNVRAKGHCIDAAGTFGATGNKPLPSTESECTAATLKWVEEDSHGIPAPECHTTSWSRDNHLGNTFNGYQASYNWTLPTRKTEKCVERDDCTCVLRLRYNISTADVDGFGFADSTKNAGNSPITNDPYIPLEGDTSFNVSLAIDTSQFARTFQDRSHVFHILPRPKGVSPLARIFNLNVRGKRGNIVQAYPATEYDFVPEILHVRKFDYIHFQWTGCDTNPAGNAGEGKAGTDRSNIVQIADIGKSYPASEDWLKSNTKLFDNLELRQRMAYLDQTPEKCDSLDTLKARNNNDNNDVEQDPRNCFKLNAASRYFNGGLIQMNNTGEFYYMSSRNNNFSNRGQKGNINVNNVLPNWAIAITVIGGTAFLASGAVGGLMLYARAHPESAINSYLTRI